MLVGTIPCTPPTANMPPHALHAVSPGSMQGAQKDMGLHNYASRFAAAGLAVFVFDYRTFGGSDGEPRNWISPRRHLQDWRAALKHVTETLAPAGVLDGSKVALWGTSFGGGHALVMAGEMQDKVSAVVAQVGDGGGEEQLLGGRDIEGVSEEGLGAAAECTCVHNNIVTSFCLANNAVQRKRQISCGSCSIIYFCLQGNRVEARQAKAHCSTGPTAAFACAGTVARLSVTWFFA